MKKKSQFRDETKKFGVLCFEIYFRKSQQYMPKSNFSYAGKMYAKFDENTNEPRRFLFLPS